MKVSQVTFLNALTLVLIGAWGYLSKPVSQSSELIPIVFGVLFFSTLPPLRHDNRIVEFILRSLTFLLTIALILALVNAIGENRPGAILRNALMLISTIFHFLVLMRKLLDRLKERRKSRG